MTPEERQLLIKDLCARLPYRVKGLHRGQVHIIANMDGGSLYPSIQVNGYCAWFPVETFKPYLRPLSSMTEEEKKELERLIDEKLNRNTDQEDDEWTPWVLYDTTGIKNYIGGESFYFDEMGFIYDWLNAHHFDYRGLIPMGLALEAPEGMYEAD